MSKHAQTEYIRDLVIARLRAMPPDMSVSIGDHGDYNPEQLIKQIQAGSEIGNTAIDIELSFLRRMPKLAHQLGQA